MREERREERFIENKREISIKVEIGQRRNEKYSISRNVQKSFSLEKKGVFKLLFLSKKINQSRD